jgi:hypothetical protein
MIHGAFRLPSTVAGILPTAETTHHNRGRRGGLISDDRIVKKTPGKPFNDITQFEILTSYKNDPYIVLLQIIVCLICNPDAR